MAEPDPESGCVWIGLGFLLALAFLMWFVAQMYGPIL